MDTVRIATTQRLNGVRKMWVEELVRVGGCGRVFFKGKRKRVDGGEEKVTVIGGGDGLAS